MLYEDTDTGNERLEGLTRGLLEELGENPEREGLVKTPARMASALAFLTKGYHEDPATIIGDALFEAESQEIILVRGIEFYSLCEHHMLPFIGTAHIGYIPNQKIVGLSKIARIVEVFSRRLQVQERLTQQVADCLLEHLAPLGVAVVMEANHLCMMMRGVEKQGSSTVTSAMHGTFRENQSTRNEFMGLIRGVR
ncbi:MAG: GTP cyclohydrolase I FolE [Candidatus Eremiobacteraeota bacterium]|nr:GTP cyclohydrolase I FolE [Candidatus Eremiobacteraeota bacterium]